MNLIKGAIHIHSLYSADGEKSLEEIKHTLKGKGVEFICCTEHSSSLKEPEVSSFISECKLLSDNDFVIIPGFEFQCESVEVLGLNVTRNLRFSGLNNLVEQIKENGGLAILAHPYKYKSDYNLDSLEKLNGIEVWNCRYEGVSAPRIRNIKLLKKLNKGRIFAYAGLDLHNDKQNIQLYQYLTVEKLDPKEIIKALEEGRFYIKSKKIELNAEADINLYESIIFSLSNLRHDFFNRVLNIVRRIFRYLHIKPTKYLYRIMALLDIRQ